MNKMNKTNLIVESKADQQKLIDWAGDELAKKFNSLKHRIKSPENDLYYWIKNKTPEELEAFITELEDTSSKAKAEKEIADEGAKLIQETAHWKVYHITTFEASQKYGRDTKWCITGIGSYKDHYWTRYINQGYQFYFLIAKENYDPRGSDSKFAVAAFPGDKPEIYDQQDRTAHYTDIPWYEEINIPGVELENAELYYNCEECGRELYEQECYFDPNGGVYCEDCFFETCAFCEHCGELMWLDDAITLDDGDGELYCSTCAAKFKKEIDNWKADDDSEMIDDWPEVLKDGTYATLDDSLDEYDELLPDNDGEAACKYCGNKLKEGEGYCNIWGNNIGYSCCNDKYLDGNFTTPAGKEVGLAEYFVVLVRDGFYEFEDDVAGIKNHIKAWVKARNTGELKYSSDIIKQIEESAIYQITFNNYMSEDEVTRLFK